MHTKNWRKVNIRLLTRASRREKTRARSSGPEPLWRFRSPKVEALRLRGTERHGPRMRLLRTRDQLVLRERLADCAAGDLARGLHRLVEFQPLAV
jgi:hypothetical protein